MSEFIQAHNVSILLYHIVCPEKYRRVVINEEVDKTIKETCEETGIFGGIPAVLRSNVSSHLKLSFSSIGRAFLLSWLDDSSLASSRL
jgi:hypothetical protein